MCLKRVETKTYSYLHICMKELQKEPRDHKWLPAGEGWERRGLGAGGSLFT